MGRAQCHHFVRTADGNTPLAPETKSEAVVRFSVMIGLWLSLMALSLAGTGFFPTLALAQDEPAEEKVEVESEFDSEPAPDEVFGDAEEVDSDRNDEPEMLVDPEADSEADRNADREGINADGDSDLESELQEAESPTTPPPGESLPAPELEQAQSPGSLFSEPLSVANPEENPLQGPRYIHHPNADKGLMRITRDKVYRYRVPVSQQTKAASFRLGTFEPTQLANKDADIYFDEVYDPALAPILLVDYEWQILKSPLGKFGVKVGSGLFIATGHGRLKTTGEEALEGFTFVAFPNNASGIYRAQFWDKQPIVPFAEGGITAFTFAEIRDDSKGPKFGGSLAAHFSGGLAFSLNFLDMDSLSELDREYGINTVWLVVEGRTYKALSDKFDFSGEFINAGVMAEF